MGLENIRNKKLLYHLTSLKNMNSIIEYGLMSRAQLVRRGLTYDDIADKRIINKREELGLDEYVPFHFHPYSAFDVAVKESKPNETFVYVTISREQAELAKFKILPKHPLSQEECILHDYAEGIDLIDWDTMETVGTIDTYSKNVKMAECLSDKPLPATSIQCVYVPNDLTKKQVEQLFLDKGICEQPPYVSVMETFF